MTDLAKEMLPRCGGKPSVEEITDGMNAALGNARRLIRDAELLFENERYPSALSLSILSIEEAGKIPILRNLLTCPNDRAKELWKDYRSHRAKNTAWVVPQLVQNGARTLYGLREALNAAGEHTAILDILKQISFYTDFVGKRNWTKPADVIDKNLAQTILQTAKILVKDGEVTLEENQLWIKHLGPNSLRGMSQAGLADYFLEARERGLVNHDSDLVMKFIYGGVSEVSK